MVNHRMRPPGAHSRPGPSLKSDGFAARSGELYVAETRMPPALMVNRHTEHCTAIRDPQPVVGVCVAAHLTIDHRGRGGPVQSNINDLGGMRTRVLILSWEYPPVVVGGLGRHVHALATALHRGGHEVTV